MAAPPKKGGLSLYANLLQPEKEAQGATIAGAPVRYDTKKLEEEKEAQKKKDASLKFQPIKRPQAQAKGKPKTTTSSTHKFSSSVATATTVTASSPDKQTASSTPQQQPSIQKTNFNDWIGDEDEEVFFDRPKHERGGRKKKKKNKPETRVWDWDDIYDPTLPNNYADYKGSEEQYREIRDWKARLYYHQLKGAKKNGRATDSEETEDLARPKNNMFAPPSNLNFAPPSFDDAPKRPMDDEDDEYYPPPPNNNMRSDDDLYDPPPSFAPAQVFDDATGDDAYARRMRLSGLGAAPTGVSALPAQVPAPPPVVSTPAPQHPGVSKAAGDIAAKKAEAQAKLAAMKAKLEAARPKTEAAPAVTPTPPLQISAPAFVPSQISASAGPYDATHAPPPPPPPPPPEEVQQPGVSLSRAPVRYEITSTSVGDDCDTTMRDAGQIAPEAEQPRSSRPGQKGFAERLLKKYGWEKGQGLGATGDGITTAIVAKADKRKKRADAEGGGWAAPKNMGKIVGGKRRKIESTADDDGKLGAMSDVVKLEGMLDGLDVHHEISENNLMQEIGDEFGSNYGNIERLFIWREEMGGKNEVFVKFTNQLSALRAVNATDGMTFAGNAVQARFFESEKFESGQYA